MRTEYFVLRCDDKKLLQYDDEDGRRSISVPNGAHVIASASDLEKLLELMTTKKNDRYFIIQYDRSTGRGSMSTPSGTQVITTSPNPNYLSETVAAMTGLYSGRLATDGADDRSGGDKEDG